MKFTPEVIAALQTLKDAAENEIELHYVTMLEKNFAGLLGKRFTRLTVIERVESDRNGNAQWKCRCDCGNEVIANTYALTHGRKKSCGCLQKERILESITKHGMHHTKIYKSWGAMKARCFNPNNKFYKNYGGRGITIYPAWINDFQAFYDYVSKLENFGKEGYTLDRINNNGNYEPGNLRWADKKTQLYNRRNTILVKYGTELLTLEKAAETSGIAKATLFGRIKAGDTGDKLFRPAQTHSKR